MSNEVLTEKNIDESCELNGYYPSDEARLLLLMPRLKRNQKSNMELIRELEGRNL